jgi:hypothetical protein
MKSVPDSRVALKWVPPEADTPKGGPAPQRRKGFFFFCIPPCTLDVVGMIALLGTIDRRQHADAGVKGNGCEGGEQS